LASASEHRVRKAVGHLVNHRPPSRDLLLAALAFIGLAGCDLPRDPNGTAHRVEGGVLRVGVSENRPWVRFDGPEPQGVEPALVRELAAEQHARVVWVRNGETPLLKALGDRELDLVIGGLLADSPWAGQLGVTRPYLQLGRDQHVWLTQSGENQWLLRLDRFLAAHKDEALARRTAETGP
jgi:ABC-type amino acid transport substrate-binding protein